MACLLVLDIGGSYIKYGVADAEDRLMPETVGQAPAHAGEDAEAFFGELARILHRLRAAYPLRRACVSIPGPFDFSQGVSWMKHKFAALYGRSLRPAFADAGLDVSFLHDSTAFLLGEYDQGVLRGAERPCCVMLGTGLGFAWMRDGAACVDERRTPSLTLWNAPYLDATAENYVSSRAIRALYGEEIEVREIAARARAGDARAANAFRTTGAHLSAILTPLLKRLACDRLALGGQIAKSADLLALTLPVPWFVSARLDDAALLGACRFARLGEEACEQVLDPNE